MLSTVYSAGVFGIEGFIVSVECNGLRRIPDFHLVGLPDLAVREAHDRVYTACENSGYKFPSLDLMINLAPADRKKEGSGFDTAILLGILHCGGICARSRISRTSASAVSFRSLEASAVSEASSVCVRRRAMRE